jgi:hypothetical protein
MTGNFHVRSGESRFRRRRGLEQKGVDILLAIEALQHATLGNVDTACFMLSDLDFYPLFDALVQTRVKSTLYYDPHHTSRELIYAADLAQALNAASLNRWLRNDLMSQTALSGRQGYPLPASEGVVDEWTAKCGARTILIRKERDTDYFFAHYQDCKPQEIWWVAKMPYMLLSMFEDAPGQKVTGAERFGFP